MNMSLFPKGPNKLFYNTLTTYRPVACRWNSRQFSSRKVSIEEKIGLTPKPKRPLSVYLRFSAKMRPMLLQENPNASVIEIAKIVGEKWKNIDPILKDELQDEYKKDWLKYVAKCEEYDKTLSPADKMELMRAKEDERLAKERKARKKLLGQLGCPKRPGSSYLFFLKERASERGNLSFQEWQEKLASEWKLIPEDKKQKYYTQYKKEMEEYKIKLQKWEHEMSQKGFRDVAVKDYTVTSTDSGEEMKEYSKHIQPLVKELIKKPILVSSDYQTPAGKTESHQSKSKQNTTPRISLYISVVFVASVASILCFFYLYII